jgi:hypothetical protein
MANDLEGTIVVGGQRLKLVGAHAAYARFPGLASRSKRRRNGS